MRRIDGVPVVAYNEVEDVLKIQSMQRKWRDGFPGAELNTDLWNLVQQGAGQTITLTGGELRIAAGTTANQETIIHTKELFMVPFRVMFGMYLSQRIANQEFYLGLVSEDGEDLAEWKLDGTTATNGKNDTQNTGLLRAGANSTILTTASYSILEIEPFVDETWFHSRFLDSASGRSASFVRHRNIPDPNKKYYARIRVKNLGAAPASSTTLYVAFVAIQDYSELTTEITAGRGGVAAGHAIPVYPVGGSISAYYAYNRATWYTDTTTNLAGDATFTGTSRDQGTTGLYSYFRTSVYADLPGTLNIEQSRDGTVWRTTHTQAVAAGETQMINALIFRRYVRVKYVNGATATTALEVCSTLIAL